MNTHVFVLFSALLVSTSFGCGDDADPSQDVQVREETDSVATPQDMPESQTPVETPEPGPVVDPTPDPDPDPVDPMPDPMPAPCLVDEGCINTFPTQIFDTTVGGTRDKDTYSCRPDTNESGPERMYRIEMPTAGFLAVEVLSEDINTDVDVHLLLENDVASCMDRGNYTAGAYLEPGTYWLAADTWVDSAGTEYAGAFELSINVVTVDDLAALGIQRQAAEDAMTAFTTAWQRLDTKRFEYAITDFSMHSRLKRQWIYQMATGQLLYNLTVGHGEGSIVGNDLGMASVFSNIPESHQSSVGLVKTAETYVGDYGYSLRIDGLEPDFNSNVRDRFIVVHPWYGNRPDVVATEGWVVPTWGCATIDPAVSEQVINTIRGGALMFFWYPDATYRGASTYL
ncbi:MAG: murein L,D-transpeptidase catalytic domain family protein [bacterium]